MRHHCMVAEYYLNEKTKTEKRTVCPIIGLPKENELHALRVIAVKLQRAQWEAELSVPILFFFFENGGKVFLHPCIKYLRLYCPDL